MKTFRIIYNKNNEIKEVAEIDNISLFNSFMCDGLIRKESIKVNIAKNRIYSRDKYYNYLYLIADTLEQAFNIARKESLENE